MYECVFTHLFMYTCTYEHAYVCIYLSDESIHTIVCEITYSQIVKRYSLYVYPYIVYLFILNTYLLYLNVCLFTLLLLPYLISYPYVHTSTVSQIRSLMSRGSLPIIYNIPYLLC